jgi:hypothetical protein
MVATNKLAAVMTEVTGGGAGAPIVTSIGNLTLSNTTPNGRIDYGDTPASTFAAGAGCMAVSLEFTASNYFTTQTASHTAIVLRQDMALASLQVRGQGAIFGALSNNAATAFCDRASPNSSNASANAKKNMTAAASAIWPR